ncbi:MAG: SMP-30/gluconolactonase/LRE family protein [Verrucomicrobiota bacterium]
MEKPEPIGNRISQWGEGPIWVDDQLYYVDIKGQAICSYDPKSSEETEWNFDQEIGFVVGCQSGKLLYGGTNGLFFLDPDSGQSELIVDPENEMEDNRFNDGKTSPEGRVFAGTISGKREPVAKLYRLDPDRRVHIAYEPVTVSNGIVWSPDGATCYYIDTPSKEVKAFDYESDTGELVNPRAVIDTSNIQASADGMAIDVDGNLWVTMCHGGCVVHYDSQSGKEIKRIEFPAVEVTACAFGGEKMDELYVTSGIYSKGEDVHGGRLFVVRDLGVSGSVFPHYDDRL